MIMMMMVVLVMMMMMLGAASFTDRHFPGHARAWKKVFKKMSIIMMMMMNDEDEDHFLAFCLQAT